MHKLLPYRPARGPQGDAFVASLCARCRRDASESVTCRLLIRGLMLRGAQLFPQEWVMTDGEPDCLAFVPRSVSRASPSVSEPAPLGAPAQFELSI